MTGVDGDARDSVRVLEKRLDYSAGFSDVLRWYGQWLRKVNSVRKSRSRRGSETVNARRLRHAGKRSVASCELELELESRLVEKEGQNFQVVARSNVAPIQRVNEPEGP